MLSLCGPVFHGVSLGSEKSSLLPAVIQPLVVDNVASSGQTAQELDRTTDLGNEGMEKWGMRERGMGNEGMGKWGMRERGMRERGMGNEGMGNGEIGENG